jgi:ribosomal protein S19E (S16A)
MAEEEASFQPKAVKDVPAEQFISAYAAHLKTNDKVRSRCSGSLVQAAWQRVVAFGASATC